MCTRRQLVAVRCVAEGGCICMYPLCEAFSLMLGPRTCQNRLLKNRLNQLRPNFGRILLLSNYPVRCVRSWLQYGADIHRRQ